MNKQPFTGIYRRFLFILNISSMLCFFSESARADWDWQLTPKVEDWSTFAKLSPSTKSQLWHELEQRQISFEDLSWQWRLAWVKACEGSQESWCAILLQTGLFDKALIVRAETALALGTRFEGTGHGPALRLLESAYAVQQNHRNNEPLFIQFRILRSIQKIGGPVSSRLGKKLAQRSERTARYWASIQETGRSE